MSPINLRKGLKFLYRGQIYTFLKVTENVSEVLAINDQTNTIDRIPIDEIEFDINTSSQNQNAKTGIDSNVVPDKHWQIAKQRLEIIKPLIKPDRTKQEVLETAREHKIHPATIYRWIKNYEESGGLLSSLLPSYGKRGGKGQKRTEKETEELLNLYIKEVYLAKDRKVNIKRAYLEFYIDCQERGIQPVHYNTFRNRIKELDQYLVTLKREGKARAKALYGASENSFEANYPLEIIQIDHTILDIIIVDEITRQPVGRPYITVAMDVYSRMIYGFYLTLEPPSVFSVGQTIFLGALRKENYLRNLGIDGEWNIWGIPKNLTIHTDNAKEFRSNDFLRFCEEFGINVSYRPVRTPYYGGHIERFIRTLNTEIHNLPGSTFSNPQHKGEYKPEKHASLTLTELEKWIAQYIVNIYHKTPHSELGKPPAEKFKEGIIGTKDTPGIGLPAILTREEAERLRFALLPSFQKTIQKDGVHFKGIRYFDNILRPFIRYGEKINTPKQKFTFKYDPRDASQIYFLNPKDNTYYKVSCRDKRMPKVSFWEIKKVKAYLQKKGINKYTEDDIIKAIKEMHQIEKEAIQKTKEARRKNTSRINHERKKELENQYLQNTQKQTKDTQENPVERDINVDKSDIFDIKDDEIFDIG